MVSGMDIDQMVKDMMRVQRIRVDKVTQDKQILTWRQELYNSINKDFANLILDTKKEFGLLRTSSTGVMLNNSANNLSWVKKAETSDSSIVSVSSTSRAVEGNYSVKVNRLADGVSMASGSAITKTVNGQTQNATNLEDLWDSETLPDKIEFKIRTSAGEVTFKFGDGVGKTNIDDNIVTIDKKLNEISLSDIARTINNAQVKKDGRTVNLGVNASYDASIGRFFMNTSGTGEGSKLVVTSDKVFDANNNQIAGRNNDNQLVSSNKGFIEKLNLNVKHYIDDELAKENGAMPTIQIGAEYKGVDALIDFNGATGIKQSSNQFTINGINLDLKSVSDKTINVRVGTDVDAFYSKITSFVEKYNELVEKTNNLLTEKQHRSFRPLTDEQKEAMKEKEIELWESRAKSGLLRNDSIISSTMQRVRGGMYEPVVGVTGPYSHLTQIGITTERYSTGASGGKLEINEEKLKAAIRDNPDAVLELLFKESKATDEQDRVKQSGVITRLYDNLTNGMKQIINKSGTGDNASVYRNVNSTILLDFVTQHGSISMLDRDMTSLDRRIDNLNDYLARTEERYYRQFTAMEKAMQQMSSQSMWLMQQFGGY